MSQKYVVSHLEEQLGPFDEAELKAKWVKGDILPIDYIYDESKQDWILLSERFPWALGKVETGAPPPLSETTLKKKTATTPPQTIAVPADAIPNVAKTMVSAKPTPAAEAANAPVAAATPVAPTPAPTPATIQMPAPAASAHTQAATTSSAHSAPSVRVAHTNTTVPSAPKEAAVELVNGKGEVDLSTLQPGRVELVLHQSSEVKVPIETPLQINVRPSEPVLIEWTVPSTQTVGEDAEVHITALDEAGRVCTHYHEQYLLRIKGPSPQDVPVKIVNGKATVALQQTKAEAWSVSLIYSGSRKLQLPTEKHLEWQPGPASKLILDGPKEYVTGYPLKVQVQAVDQFGNLAKTLHGTVVLEVKAS
jgi:hypothetical protein